MFTGIPPAARSRRIYTTCADTKRRDRPAPSDRLTLRYHVLTCRGARKSRSRARYPASLRPWHKLFEPLPRRKILLVRAEFERWRVSKCAFQSGQTISFVTSPHLPLAVRFFPVHDCSPISSPARGRALPSLLHGPLLLCRCQRLDRGRDTVRRWDEVDHS